MFIARQQNITTASSILLFLTLFVPHAVYAQGELSVATAQPIANEQYSFGDVVSFDGASGQFVLADEVGDPDMFGVLVQQPLFVYQGGGDGVPIVREGQVSVNATTINGPIERGDAVTSSLVPGKAQRADESTSAVLGTALTPLSEADGAATTTAGGQQVTAGTVTVLLNVGSSAAEGGAGSGAQQQNDLTSGISEATILNIIQYVVAAVIALGSVYIAFRNFMPSIRHGITSVGRNPRAKSSIQTMVLFNIVLIIVISGAGLFIAFLIISLEL